MRLSTLLPPRLLQSIDRARTRMFLAKIRGPTAEYVRRNGLEVKDGPFVGMRYADGLGATVGDLVAKLVGSYECELHGVLEQWIRAEYPQVIDVGCAEGYYAVGFAVAMPRSRIDAFDIDAAARSQCAALADLNAVGERVRVLGTCEPQGLASYPEHGVALLSDCEGYERVLLNPDVAPNLRHWPILVELHEFVDRSIMDTLRRRFASTHGIDIIDGQDRDRVGLEQLDFMTTRQRQAVLGERRPGPMRWAYLYPR
jgi:hypothetical protein